jgi:hypothetical protein
MKLRKAVLSVCGLSLLSGLAVADTKALLAVSAEGVEFRALPKPRSLAHVLPSAIPGTMIIRLQTNFEYKTEFEAVCYYLVKGDPDEGKALLAAMKPENVIQFNCERAVK